MSDYSFVRDKMKVRYFTFLAFIIFISGSNYSFALISDQPDKSVKEFFHKPNKVIEIFLKAVSKGELIVFNRKLDSSMLLPIRVEYVYELNSTLAVVKVYSELKQPIPVEEHNCKIHGVSAILDANGHITEVEIHILSD